MSKISQEIQKKHAAILFADVKGYSTLTEYQLQQFFTLFLPELGNTLNKHISFYKNSWGDAIVAAFEDPLQAADCALSLRDEFNSTNWDTLGIPSLSLRTSLKGDEGVTP